MKTIEILVGIPCSGKSTYAEKQTTFTNFKDINTVVISRDKIRENLFGKKYVPSKEKEKKVTRIFDFLLEENLFERDRINTIILDNTHCKESYINEIISKYGSQCLFEIKSFPVPLWKAYLRNIGRYIKIGKWVPFWVIKQMHKNYNKLKTSKYRFYIK